MSDPNSQKPTTSDELDMRERLIDLANKNGQLEEQVKQLQKTNKDLVAQLTTAPVPRGMCYVVGSINLREYPYLDTMRANLETPTFVMVGPGVAVLAQVIGGEGRYVPDAKLCLLGEMGVMAIARDPHYVKAISEKIDAAQELLNQFDKKNEVGK